MTTSVEKGKRSKETPPSPDQRRHEILQNLLSADAERATPETVEQLLELSEQNEQKVANSVAAAAIETLHDTAVATGTIDILDPTGAQERQRDIEKITQNAIQEVQLVLHEPTELSKQTKVDAIIAGIKERPTHETRRAAWAMSARLLNEATHEQDPAVIADLQAQRTKIENEIPLTTDDIRYAIDSAKQNPSELNLSILRAMHGALSRETKKTDDPQDQEMVRGFIPSIERVLHAEEEKQKRLS